jgi:hypothetical protein
MTGTLLVKVLCESCRGRLICKILEYPTGIGYRVPDAAGALTFNPGGVFCSEHGWFEMRDPKLVSKIEHARATGKPLTYRARCIRQRPIY